MEQLMEQLTSVKRKPNRPVSKAKSIDLMRRSIELWTDGKVNRLGGAIDIPDWKVIRHGGKVGWANWKVSRPRGKVDRPDGKVNRPGWTVDGHAGKMEPSQTKTKYHLYYNQSKRRHTTKPEQPRQSYIKTKKQTHQDQCNSYYYQTKIRLIIRQTMTKSIHPHRLSELERNFFGESFSTWRESKNM